MDARSNYAFGTLTAGIVSGATSLTVGAGEGARFPVVPFNAVIWNTTDYTNAGAAYHATQAEIVRVTNISTDTLTITRAQEGTADINLNTGGKTYQIWDTPTSGYWDQLYANGEVMTTRGDLVRRGAGNPERFSVGSFSASLLSDGTDPAWSKPQDFAVSFDDFTGGSSPFSETGWTGSPNSGSLSSGNGEPGAPGVLVLSTSTSSSSSPTINRATTSVLFSGGKYIFESRIKLSALSDGTETYTVKLGWLESMSITTDGVWFEYTHSANSGNWQGKTVDAGTTTVNGAVAASTNWTILRIEVAADGTSAEFFVDGVSIGVASTAANIPTTAGNETGARLGIIKSAGTTARTLSIDYVLTAIKATTSR